MGTVGRPQGTSGQAQVLSDREVETLVIEMVRSTKKTAKRNMALLIMSFKLGLRAKELASLKIKDVYDGQNLKKTLRLLSHYTKGHKHRDLPLNSPELIEVLKLYIYYRRADDGTTFNVEAPLFRSQKGGAFSPNSLARVFIDIFKNAGFEKASSHSGRRSLLTKFASKNISPFAMRYIAGHAHISTTQRYIENNPKDIAEIMKDA